MNVSANRAKLWILSFHRSRERRTHLDIGIALADHIFVGEVFDSVEVDG